MASYGLSEDDLTQIITTELERMNSAPDRNVREAMDQIMGTLLTALIRSVALAIEKNNAKLAAQIIAELRGSSTP
jgi:hypothetical protein